MGNFCENFSIHTEYGAVAATAAAIIIFGGIYVAWDYASRALKRKHVLSRSMSIGVLHGGKLSLQRTIIYHQARADPKISDRAENDLNSLLDVKHPDLWKLRVCRLSTSILLTFLSNFYWKSIFYYLFFSLNTWSSPTYFLPQVNLVSRSSGNNLWNIQNFLNLSSKHWQIISCRPVFADGNN